MLETRSKTNVTFCRRSSSHSSLMGQNTTFVTIFYNWLNCVILYLLLNLISLASSVLEAKASLAPILVSLPSSVTHILSEGYDIELPT